MTSKAEVALKSKFIVLTSSGVVGERQCLRHTAEVAVHNNKERRHKNKLIRIDF